MNEVIVKGYLYSIFSGELRVYEGEVKIIKGDRQQNCNANSKQGSHQTDRDQRDNEFNGPQGTDEQLGQITGVQFLKKYDG